VVVVAQHDECAVVARRAVREMAWAHVQAQFAAGLLESVLDAVIQPWMRIVAAESLELAARAEKHTLAALQGLDDRLQDRGSEALRLAAFGSMRMLDELLLGHALVGLQQPQHSLAIAAAGATQRILDEAMALILLRELTSHGHDKT
jgi:hypothetical protein